MMQGRRVLLLTASIVVLAATAVGPITFEEIGDRAGVRFVLDNNATPLRRQPESVIAGLGLLDYDGDGYLDIYFVNGAGMPSLIKGRGQKNRLFHNNGNLT